MDHGYFKDRISAFYDNNLKPEERIVIEEHLKECEECRKLLEEFEKLDRLVEEHSQLDGEEYWEESARKIEKSLGFDKETQVTEIAPSRWFGLTWKLVAVAASVVFLTVVGIHRNEIWHEEKPEQKLLNIPKVETPADTGMEKITDELKQVRPAEGDEDLADREIPEVEQPREVGRSDEVISEKADRPDVSLRAVSPTSPEPSDIRQVPSPAVIEKSREDVAEHSKKGLTKPGAVEPTATANQLQRAVQKAEEKTALYESIPPVKESEAESLANLRLQKDSLSRLIVAEGRWQEKTGLVQSLKGEDIKNKVPRSPADIENDLIQICYKIALLTDDREEYRSVSAIIEKVARDEKSPNRELAQLYLRQLSDQN